MLPPLVEVRHHQLHHEVSSEMLVVEILQDKAARPEGEHCARIFVPFLLELEAEMLIEALACAEVFRGQKWTKRSDDWRPRVHGEIPSRQRVRGYAFPALGANPSARCAPPQRRASGESRQTPRISKVLEPPRPPLVLRHFLQNHHCLCLAENGELGRAVWPLRLGLWGRSLPCDRDDGNEMSLDATDATLETAAVRQSGFFGGNQRRLE